MDLLQEIAARTRERVAERKKKLPKETLMDAVSSMDVGTFPFEKALHSDDMAFICETKKASPSKGIISQDYPYVEIAKDYEKAGAAAISVLTEPYYFKGDNEHLRQIVNSVKIPVLRKDFTVDDHMIYEAKALGADAILLICSLLDRDVLYEYISIADELGLSALVETHSEKEIDMALSAGARIIGVNNRNLVDFQVDTSLSERLRHLVPSSIPFVAESGIRSSIEIKRLKDAGVNAVLIGETLMRSDDRRSELLKLRGM